MIELAKVRIMEIVSVRRGRAEAISRREIAEILKHGKNPIDINDRMLRRAYEDLPFCHCEGGAFRPITHEEVEAYRDYLWPKVGPIIADRKCRVIYSTWPELVPRRGEQIQLGLGAAVTL